MMEFNFYAFIQRVVISNSRDICKSHSSLSLCSLSSLFCSGIVFSPPSSYSHSLLSLSIFSLTFSSYSLHFKLFSLFTFSLYFLSLSKAFSLSMFADYFLAYFASLLFSSTFFLNLPLHFLLLLSIFLATLSLYSYSVSHANLSCQFLPLLFLHLLIFLLNFFASVFFLHFISLLLHTISLTLFIRPTFSQFSFLYPLSFYTRDPFPLFYFVLHFPTNFSTFSCYPLSTILVHPPSSFSYSHSLHFLSLSTCLIYFHYVFIFNLYSLLLLCTSQVYFSF